MSPVENRFSIVDAVFDLVSAAGPHEGLDVIIPRDTKLRAAHFPQQVFYTYAAETSKTLNSYQKPRRKEENLP